MKRNGDVVAELKSCNPPNCGLIRNSFNLGKYKMCKDDIVTPLFCCASDCIGKGIIMDSEGNSAKRYLNSEANKVNLFSPRRNYICEDERNLPIIESSPNNCKSICSSPAWEKPPMLQSFSPKKVEKLALQESFINGSKFLVAESIPSPDCKYELLPQAKSGLNLKDSSVISDKLLLDYDAETSSSSIEEVYCSPGKKWEPESENREKILQNFKVDSNCNINLKTFLNESENNVPVLPSPSSPKLPAVVSKDASDADSPVKSDRIMPELLPTLICLDDEDSIVPEDKKEQCEVINVADSPEMPTLIPFTSDLDEKFHIKTELLSDDDADEIQRAKILLGGLSGSQSGVVLNRKINISSVSVRNNGISINEGPEIEEIEGVRFFQFRSKQEMEDFKRTRKELTETDDDMIIPTKTTDITQIKGWRTKYFAPESQFQPHTFTLDFLKADDFSHDSKLSIDHAVDENSDENKKECSADCSEFESKNNEITSDFNESKISDCSDSPLDKKENKEKIQPKVLKEETKNSMSAFVSEELEKYLLNSSKLNVSLLEKVNPNIVPIPSDASILSIGNLRKYYPFHPTIMFKRKREFIPVEMEENDSSESPIIISDSPEISNVIDLGSSDESSEEDDIPVAKLVKPKKKFIAKKRYSIRGLKRKSIERELTSTIAAKRVVLRLTKEDDGVSKGYKVSDISCKKDKPDSMSRASSPSSVSSIDDRVEMPPDGSLPVIKQTLFSKRNEPQLLEEFLNNLNMYGTRKDVAMLVQSNQSYFDEGPILNAKSCTKAISVLVSNQVFVDNKQKLKKKKLKTWEKYLPKKLSDKQKMKITKRKTRIQKLLEDAGELISADRGKRSIRLPARYLDSAVLAASEWVSPVITLDESPSHKVKHPSTEIANKSKSIEDKTKSVEDKTKSIEDNKTKETVSSSSSSSESESASSSGSSDSSSDEAEDSNIKSSKCDNPQKRLLSMSKVPMKRKKIDNPGKNSPKTPISSSCSPPASQIKISPKTESKSSNSQTSLNKKSPKSLAINSQASPASQTKKTSKLLTADSLNSPISQSVISPKANSSKKKLVTDDQSSANKINVVDKKKDTVSSSKKYFMPNCSCKHCSRTAAFDNKQKYFYCNLCYATQKKRSPKCKKKEPTNAHSSDNQSKEMSSRDLPLQSKKTESDQIKVEIENESVIDLTKRNSSLIVNNSMDLPLRLNENKVSARNEKGSEPIFLSSGVLLNKPQVSDGSSPILVSSASVVNDTVLKQDSQIQSVTENNNMPPISPSSSSSNANNKYILLLAPVKSVGNVNHSSQSNAMLSPTNSNEVDKTKDIAPNKAPILIRKTSTGFVSNVSYTDGYMSSCSKTTPVTMSYTTHDPSNPASASYRLSKIAENASLVHHQFVPSISSVTYNNKNTKPPNVNFHSSPVSNASNSLNASKIVTAYRLGDNLYLLPPKETKPASVANSIARPTIVHAQNHSDLPVISSVQSVQPNNDLENNAEYSMKNCQVLENGLTKCSLVKDSSPSQNALLSNHHNYTKKPRKRRKSPLSKMYVDDDDDDVTLPKKISPEQDGELDLEVDVETVDNVFNPLSELRKKPDIESEEDISDSECVDIFNSSADHLASMYSQKTLKERRRRLLIKSGFENLRSSSKHFKNAKTCLEILQMALFVVNSHKKKEGVLLLAKQRLKYHNAMLMGKMMKQFEGIASPDLRKNIKTGIIKGLALDRENYQKSLLPLLSEGKKGTSIGNSKRKKSKPDIEIDEKKKLDTIDPKQEQFPSNSNEKDLVNADQCNRAVSGSILESFNSSNTSSFGELKKLLAKPPAIGNKSSSELILESSEKVDINQSTSHDEEMKKKLLLDKEKGESSDSATEELVSEGRNSEMSEDDNDCEDIQVCGSLKPETFCTKSSYSSNLSGTSGSDEGQSKYPGLIPLFHPKVFKENFKTAESCVHTINREIPSRRTKINNSRHSARTPTSVKDLSSSEKSQNYDDDDISIIGSSVLPLVHANSIPFPISESSATAKTDVELRNAALTASKLFGPVKVQKVQLKNGKMVFAYEHESASANPGAKLDSPPQNVNCVKNSDSEFPASNNSPNKNKPNVPEEIVLSDSEDESESALKTLPESVSNNKHVGVSKEKSTVEPQPQNRPTRVNESESDSESEQMYIDESDLQNMSNSSL